MLMQLAIRPPYAAWKPSPAGAPASSRNTSSRVDSVGSSAAPVMPRAASSEDLEKRAILLAVTSEGRVYHGGREIGFDGVRAVVSALLEEDQGLPVIKYAGFGNAVNVTLGLSIIRTSVDHGTALDIAGTGKADSGSLIAAVELAAELAGQ